MYLRDDRGMEPIPPELFLDANPGPIQGIGHRLRELVREAVPHAARFEAAMLAEADPALG